MFVHRRRSGSAIILLAARASPEAKVHRKLGREGVKVCTVLLYITIKGVGGRENTPDLLGDCELQ